MKKKHWLKKEIPLEPWIHSKFRFNNDKEFAIFLAWSILVAVLIYNAR